jgi:WD40 repeat protein
MLLVLLQAQTRVNELLIRRVHMLEYALKQERSNRDKLVAAAASQGTHASTAVLAPDRPSVPNSSALPPPLTRPALDHSASQAVAAAYLSRLGYLRECFGVSAEEATGLSEADLQAQHKPQSGRFPALAAPTVAGAGGSVVSTGAPASSSSTPASAAPANSKFTEPASALDRRTASGAPLRDPRDVLRDNGSGAVGGERAGTRSSSSEGGAPGDEVAAFSSHERSAAGATGAPRSGAPFSSGTDAASFAAHGAMTNVSAGDSFGVGSRAARSIAAPAEICVGTTDARSDRSSVGQPEADEGSRAMLLSLPGSVGLATGSAKPLPSTGGPPAAGTAAVPAAAPGQPLPVPGPAARLSSGGASSRGPSMQMTFLPSAVYRGHMDAIRRLAWLAPDSHQWVFHKQPTHPTPAASAADGHLSTSAGGAGSLAVGAASLGETMRRRSGTAFFSSALEVQAAEAAALGTGGGCGAGTAAGSEAACWTHDWSLAPVAAGAAVYVPLAATCSDDGSVKVWATPSHVAPAGLQASAGALAALNDRSSRKGAGSATSGMSGVGAARGKPGLAGRKGDGEAAGPRGAVPALPPTVASVLALHRDSDVEPVRTLRGHRGPVLAIAEVAWSTPSSGAPHAFAPAPTAGGSSLLPGRPGRLGGFGGRTASPVAAAAAAAAGVQWMSPNPSAGHQSPAAFVETPAAAAAGAEAAALGAAAGERAPRQMLGCGVAQFVLACLAQADRSQESISHVLRHSSPSSLLATAGEDGAVCLWLRPHDTVDLAKFSVAAPPLLPSLIPGPYELPGWVGLPLYRFSVVPPAAAAPPIWCLSQLPSGFSLGKLLRKAASPRASAAGATAGVARRSSETAAEVPPAATFPASTGSACTLLTALGNTLQVWAIGLDAAGMPCHSLLASVDVLAAAARGGVAVGGETAPGRVTGSSEGEEALGMRPPRITCLCPDSTATSLSVFVGLSSRTVLRVDLEQEEGGRVTLHSRAPLASAGASLPPGAGADAGTSASPPARGVPQSASVAGRGRVWGQTTSMALHPFLPYLFVGHAEELPHQALGGSAGAAVTRPGGVTPSGSPSPGALAVFDIRSGACVLAFPAHAGAVTSVAVDPSGQLLASTGNEGEVRVWSTASHDCVWRSKAHVPRFGEAAQCAAFHPTRPALLLTAGGDAVVKAFVGKGSSSPAAAAASATATGAPPSLPGSRYGGSADPSASEPGAGAGASATAPGGSGAPAVQAKQAVVAPPTVGLPIAPAPVDGGPSAAVRGALPDGNPLASIPGSSPLHRSNTAGRGDVSVSLGSPAPSAPAATAATTLRVPLADPAEGSDRGPSVVLPSAHGGRGLELAGFGAPDTPEGCIAVVSRAPEVSDAPARDIHLNDTVGLAALTTLTSLPDPPAGAAPLAGEGARRSIRGTGGDLPARQRGTIGGKGRFGYASGTGRGLPEAMTASPEAFDAAEDGPPSAGVGASGRSTRGPSSIAKLRAAQKATSSPAPSASPPSGSTPPAS